MSILYNTLVDLCDCKGITPYRMCKDVGIQPSVISDLKMERKNSLSAKTLQKIAEYFGVTVDYLLGKEVNDKLAAAEDNELAEILEDIRRNPDLRAMFSLTKNATPEQVRQYIDVIKAIRGEGKNE